jgi:4-hydroxythreonine-4-phosphate dehydrogenase
VVPLNAPEEADALPASTLGVLSCSPDLPPPPTPYPWGRAVPAFGRLQYDALLRAVTDARAGRIAAISTAPWHKKRLADAGLPPTGHTEVLAEACEAPRVLMLLAGDRLRVALATVHLPLSEVPAALSRDGIVADLRLLDAWLLRHRQFAGARPHIAVCGLNPHAGEEGIMGTEEGTLIAPAIADATALGLRVSGPWPADTVFPQVAHGYLDADAVLAMYHDQGLGPLKTWHFGESANITVGLPIVRTSVDHGTAYDIAGTGTARVDSFLYATRLAARLAQPG